MGKGERDLTGVGIFARQIKQERERDKRVDGIFQ